MAYKIHHRSIMSKILNMFVKIKVLPFCMSRNRPQSVFLIDYTFSHWNKKLVEICHEVDVLLIYLPPYLANFNFIETLFLLLKW